MIKLFKELYIYREFLKTSVKKEIRGKYKGAWLGIMWSFLNPLFMSLVFVAIFSQISGGFQYNISAVVIGVTAWGFFATGISQGTICVVSNGAILKKVYFPRQIIPISYAISQLVVFFITSSITMLIIAIEVRHFSWTMLLFPVIAFIQFLLVLSFSFITSSLFVYLRDLEHIISVIIQALFYITGAAFPIEYQSYGLIVGTIIRANPMYHLLDAYRKVLLYESLPSPQGMIYVISLIIILLLIGLPLFKKLEKRFVEEF